MSKDKSMLADASADSSKEDVKSPDVEQAGGEEPKVPTVADMQAAVEALQDEADEAEEAALADEKPEVVESVEPEYTKAEQEAMKQGWRPKDKLPEGEEFFPAEEFLRRGKLMGTITKLKRKTVSHEKVISDLTEITKNLSLKVKEAELKDVMDARKTAIESGDVETVVEYDKQLEEARKTINTADQEILSKFVNDNTHWFNETTPKTKEMKQFAIEKANEIEYNNRGTPQYLVLQQVKDAVEEKFASFFKFISGEDVATPVTDLKKQYVQQHTAVESAPSVKTAPKNGVSYGDLPKKARNIVRTMVMSGRAPARNDKEKADIRKALESYTKMMYENGALTIDV